MSWRPPVDSAEVRDRRELLDDEPATGPLGHDVGCMGGWCGEDEHGRPRPCLACHPAIADSACEHCAGRKSACVNRRLLSGRACCAVCTHVLERTRR